MSWRSFGWRPYVSVAERRAKAARALAKLAKKNGRTASPVVLDGRIIAATFWGKAWCENLEAYSDYANRLPRGRTYVRNGSVVDLQISKGTVIALVSGSELYKIEIKIKPLSPSLWQSIQTECAGKIDSLIELLQGKLSSAVMQLVTRHERGLFPTPKEIDLDCSCPDWADLCKHVAASLYGVGAMLDQNPGLLFLLRGVDPNDLISKASAAETVRQTTVGDGVTVMTDSEVADVFGIELETQSAVSAPEVEITAIAPISTPVTAAPKPAPKRKPQGKRKAAQKPGAAIRARIKAAQIARWAKFRQMGSDSMRKASAKRKSKTQTSPPSKL